MTLTHIVNPGPKPPPGCGGRASTFESIDCRLDALVAAVGSAQDLGRAQDALRAGVTAARAKQQGAERDVAAGLTGPANKGVKKAIRKMIGFVHRLRSLSARENIPATTRNALLDDAEPILADLETLLRQL